MNFPDSLLHEFERKCLHPLAALLDHLPSTLYGSGSQFAIDSVLSAIALYSAFHIRFDTGIPPWARPVMWAWMMIVSIIRPASMWKLGAYDVRWRFFFA